MIQTKYKYQISKIINNNNNDNVIYVDYYLNVLFSNKATNLGYLQYVSNNDNAVMSLIKGELNHDITLENPSYVLPQDNTDYYGDLITSSIITGITNSNLITSIKSYDKTNPYPIGSRVIDNQNITIIKANDDYVHYKVDLIDYITYFNQNAYKDNVVISNPNTFLETQCDFKTITVSDKYNVTVNYNTTNLVYSSTTTNIILFVNGLYIKSISLPFNLNGTFRFEHDFNVNDNVSLFYSSSTNNLITFDGSIIYTIEPTDPNNEANYVTYYFFGNKTLNRTNSVGDGFLYKSDKQHYHEKPIINNNIKVERNNLSVFKPIFDLGTINFIGDF